MPGSNKAAALYGERKPRKLQGKEISSSTTLSFTSQLSALINNSTASSTATSSKARARPKKEDIFSIHNRNTAKRAKRDLEDESPAFEQRHTTDGGTLDRGVWERSRRKMEEKARLYAAMKRGDVEDLDEKYAVDFDRKWAEKQVGEEDEDDDDDDDDDVEQEMVEYVDEFGRTRTGTAGEAARAQRIKAGEADMRSDRFTARPTAPANVIYGDTIQHQAFNPDEPITAQMEALAAKRDRSLTPPPDTHFDASKEIRTKGTGFFQFSGDAEERKRQMDELEKERLETEKKRKEREAKMLERKKMIEERRREIASARGKRKADGFLDRLGEEMMTAHAEQPATDEMTQRIGIEKAIENEELDGNPS
ncbi:Hypothetical protein R9X50_00190000 [Acrodontium crateriforme]|uniref:Uncharacterized protein n=1 Tax=Acrodontium crateriforme TaxID=150365 RepID=A0AAQ3M1B9_9PEZI|nr:Hypothetical protein R9X50_00190000 [Acrodontium crateriforme]